MVNASSGIISIFAGGGTAAGNDGFGDGGAATSSQLTNPAGVALDSTGNVYIADAGNNLIRRVDIASGIITAVAGNGGSGYSGDGGLATAATLSSPQGVWIDAANNVYVSDFGNNAIRQVSAGTQNIVTLAGSGTAAIPAMEGIRHWPRWRTQRAWRSMKTAISTLLTMPTMCCAKFCMPLRH